MSEYARCHRPLTAGALDGRGSKLHTFPAIDLEVQTSFWHPALPKVQSVNTVGVFAMTTESVTTSWPFGMWRKVSAFAALLLAFSLPALAAEPCKVNVKEATPAELAFLVQTGPVLAGRIVEIRPADLPALDAVKGVGEKWLAYNQEHVTFSGPTTCTEKLSKPKAEPARKDGGR